jgi:hypothetical protein
MKQESYDIYFGHALTRASLLFREKVEAFKAQLEAKRPNWHLLKFFGLGKSPKDGVIYTFDISQVKRAHLVVIVCDEESFGAGQESGVALEGEIKVPVLFVAHRDWERTRMVTGPAEVYPNRVLFRRYKDMDEIEGFIEEAIEHFEQSLSVSLLDYKARQLHSLDQVRILNPGFMQEAPVYAGSPDPKKVWDELAAIEAKHPVLAGRLF